MKYLLYNPQSTGYHWAILDSDTSKWTLFCAEIPTPDTRLFILRDIHLPSIESSIRYPLPTGNLKLDMPELFI